MFVLHRFIVTLVGLNNIIEMIKVFFKCYLVQGARGI